MIKIEKNQTWIKLQEACKINIEYFSVNNGDVNAKLLENLNNLMEKLHKIRPLYDKIARVAPLFDFDADTPGNGYRSFVIMVDRCLYNLLRINKALMHRKWLDFGNSHYIKEIEAYMQLLDTLVVCLEHVARMYERSTEKEQSSLFIECDAEELCRIAESVDQYSFYGHCLGFQFCKSVQRALTFIASAMATYSEIYYSDGSLSNKVNNFVLYFTKPEERAKRLVEISRWAEVEFCQSFWSLSEMSFIQYLYSKVSPTVLVNDVIHIPPEELIVESADGSLVEVPIPLTHLGMKSINVRLLSDTRRAGMAGTGRSSKAVADPSDTLIVHCHGGGFVAHSSMAHEVYLRRWTRQLQVPILSIDYSLSPEAPFPRALEEFVYVYGWVLKHGKSLLGTTLEKIILAGDSAGGALCISATLKFLELNLRLPDGICVAYTPVWVEFVSSPSRMLCLADPILPLGFLIRCLKAYTGATVDNTWNGKTLGGKGKSLMDEFIFNVPKDHFLSPYLASDQELSKMPPFKILSMDFDPCLDDCVTFAKKLKTLGVPVTLDVVPGLAHGFFNLYGISKRVVDGNELFIKRIEELIKGL